MKRFHFSDLFKNAAICLLAATFVFAGVRAPAQAKARIVAVFVLRSTDALKSSAHSITRQIALRLAQQPGWDARILSETARSHGAAAATLGAELYVIGELVQDATGARVVLASYKAGTDEQVNGMTVPLTGLKLSPDSNVLALLDVGISGGGAAADKVGSLRGTSTAGQTVNIPSGELISVIMLSDIGSRISSEGDSFAVETASDYYYKGKLILPKGSPGYGVITHLKRAGSFHAGGELNFTVKRLVAPNGGDILVETNGATADADKQTEQNGNTFGQYLLWGVGLFAKRGNDILIKKGTAFHVSTLQNATAPISAEGTPPARVDDALVSAH